LVEEVVDGILDQAGVDIAEVRGVLPVVLEAGEAARTT
jgi:hypothetical protein